MQEEIFHEFITDRNISKSAIRGYRAAFKDYAYYNQMTLQELLDEADKEEEERLRAKKRKILKRLKGYRTYKIEQGTPPGTIKDYFTKIKTFYRHFGIEIPYMPPAVLKKEYHERYDDIPNHKHIQTALESTKNLQHRAIILFMSSSGTGLAETLSITIKDFIKATKDYHNSDTINDILQKLENKKNVVPLFEMVRRKTNYPYYTCCSPEAIKAIIKYLRTRHELKPEDNLFILKERSVIAFFTRINENNGWGKVGYNIFFHTHALRKFHATTIENRDLANTLQGRKPDSVTGAYFKDNPERIREEYIKILPKLTIGKTEVYNIKSREFLKLEQQLDKRDQQYQELKTKQNELKETVDNLMKFAREDPEGFVKYVNKK